MKLIKLNISFLFITLALLAILGSSCSKSKSYSELLKEEEQAVNWYMANQQICLEIPENGNFIVGEDAPYYKMDEEGNVYMQVIKKGKEGSKAEKGDVVYFRFKRCSIKDLYAGYDPQWVGNADNITSGVENTSFVFGNKNLSSTTQYGEGLQLPLDYLNYECEVNLVLKAAEGFISEQSQCLPYIYNVKYFKAEY